MLVIHCSLYMRFDGGYARITFAYGYNMIMIEDNRWMYDGLNKSEAHSYEWIVKTKKFADRAFSLLETAAVTGGFTMLYLYTNCNNYKCKDKRTMTLHFCTYGFITSYEVWSHHDKSHHQHEAQATTQEVG